MHGLRPRNMRSGPKQEPLALRSLRSFCASTSWKIALLKNRAVVTRPSESTFSAIPARAFNRA